MKYIALLILLFSLNVNAKLCDGLFVGTDADMRSSVQKRVDKVKRLVRAGLASTSYVTQWTIKDTEAQGPFTKHGETLVNGLAKSNFEKWMNSMGKVSVGIGVYGLPENRAGTAYLRIGDKFLNHEMAADGRRPKKFKTVFYQGEAWSYKYGLTEATIEMKPSELKDILAFYKARGTRAIVAKEDMRGYEKGEILEPDFDHSGKNLREESCAGACTSFLGDHWLDNMVDQNLANRLRKIRDKYNLNFNYVARTNVWQNFRNPAAHMTVMRIETSKKEDILEDFIGEHSWGRIRGLYRYGIIPDGKPKADGSYEIGSYRSQRLTLEEYLDESN